MFIKPEELLAHTRGGLDIILHYYPQAQESVDRPGKKFKLRDEEKTASANLKKANDGNWLLTDFGGDQKPRNGIMVCMDIEGYEYATALKILAARHRFIPVEEARDIIKADFSSTDADPADQEGSWSFKAKGTFSDMEIETLFSKYVLKFVGWDKPNQKQEAYSRLAAILKRYHFHPIESYSLVKNRKVLTFAANDRYPIFTIEEEKFKKIYQPKNSDKGKRFMYHGEKPKTFIHGLKQAKAEYEKLNQEDDSTYENADEETKAKERKRKKLQELIICSGGSDAVNLAALGYWVVWQNSETEILNEEQFKQFQNIATDVYQLKDIDTTGLRTAHEEAMRFLDLKTIELPEELKVFKDARGNECKDVRDFLNHKNYWAFREQVKDALPYRFWDLVPNYQGRGEERKFVGYKYEFNNVYAYNFLKKNGFYRMKSESKKDGYFYIHIDGSIVREIRSNDIKNYIHEFLKKRKLEVDLRNTMFRSTQLSENSLSNLEEISIDFSDTGKSAQYVFFKNKSLEVTAQGIKAYKNGELRSKMVWDEDVIDHRFEVLPEMFEIKKNEEDGEYSLNILDDSSLFFKFLIQTSRVHWRNELEVKILDLDLEAREKYLAANKFNIAGSLLTDAEKEEQRKHLINKIFSIGYMLHRHKDPSKPWCIFAMDNRINDDGGSYGGSGKSIVLHKAIPFVLKKFFYLGGRNPKLTDNPHIYDGLNEYHRYILVDDADAYLNFKFFFDALTGDLKVNPKNVQPYTIPFNKVGKFAISSNFTLRDIDPSTERRINYTVFSDYYHNHGENDDYLESRTPKDDFGITLFDEFTEEEWNRFYNFMMQCLRFYLSTNDKIQPPMSNVLKRNLQTEMGHTFQAWADVYFSDPAHQNSAIIKEKALMDFVTNNNVKWTTQKFTRALKAWCRYNGYGYNPKDMQNSQGRIIQRVKDETYIRSENRWVENGEEKVKEMIYIQTGQTAITFPVAAQESKELPF